jgi:hypothetical protein
MHIRLGVLLAFLLAVASVGIGASDDAVLGTGKLNPAESKIQPRRALEEVVMTMKI